MKYTDCKVKLLFLFLQGTVANKFYVHNDVFRYQDEVFGDSDSEPPEGEILTPVLFLYNCHEMCSSFTCFHWF